MHRVIGIIVILFVMLFPVVAGADIDNALYSEVLERYVRDGLVDYAYLKTRKNDLDDYLDMMGAVSPDSLSSGEQLAFYINLYNAATLRLVVDNYPVESIKDIGSIFSSPWKLKVVRLNGEMVTLDHIEHEIVRPRFKDPRVHAALNCSATSCPPLLSVPYNGRTIDMQLEQAMVDFINDGKNNYLEGTILSVSKIFSWFSEDFPEDFVGWFMGYAKGDLKRELEVMIRDGKKPRVRYLKYDWSLNRQAQ